MESILKVVINCVVIGLLLKISYKYVMSKTGKYVNVNIEIVSERYGIELVIGLIIIGILLSFLELSFSINLIDKFNLLEYKEILVVIYVFIQIIRGREMYAYLNERSIIRDNKYNEKGNDEKIMEITNILDSYNTSYIIAKEKLELLKCVSPMSIAAVVITYILENEVVFVNWSNYLIFLFVTLFLYFYVIYCAYKRTEFFKMRELEARKDLRELEIYLQIK